MGNIDYENIPPEVYDIAYWPGTEKEAAFLASIVQRHVGDSGVTVIEPMCGTGRLLRCLKSIPWFRCLRIGSDANERSLEYAKDQDPGGVYVQVDASKPLAHRGRVVQVHAGFCTINSFRELSADGAVNHLNDMRELISLGRCPIYILGLHLTPSPTNLYIPSDESDKSTRGEVSVRRKLKVTRIDLENRVEENELDLRVSSPSGSDRYRTQIKFTTYTREQIYALFESTGWAPIEMFDFRYKRLRMVSLVQEDVIFVLRRNS